MRVRIKLCISCFVVISEMLYEFGNQMIVRDNLIRPILRMGWKDSVKGQLAAGN